MPKNIPNTPFCFFLKLNMLYSLQGACKREDSTYGEFVSVFCGIHSGACSVEYYSDKEI